MAGLAEHLEALITLVEQCINERVALHDAQVEGNRANIDTLTQAMQTHTEALHGVVNLLKRLEGRIAVLEKEKPRPLDRGFLTPTTTKVPTGAGRNQYYTGSRRLPTSLCGIPLMINVSGSGPGLILVWGAFIPGR